MTRPRLLVLLVVATAVLAAPEAAQASGDRYVAVAAGQPDDTGLATRNAAAGGWSAAQWDLTGPFGVRAPEAWDLSAAANHRAPGFGVTVAVLDTGLAYRTAPPFRRSPDIATSSVVAGRDLVDGSDRPYDRNGHGTFVASTIAAAANNSYGMVGIAYGARIMPVRVLDASGVGTAARVARGIRWAVDHDANVINISIELYDKLTKLPVSITVDRAMRQAVAYAARHRVLVVAATGNSASPAVPSTRLADDILYVGGSTEHGCLGQYSNHGPGLDVVAPGGGADSPIDGDVNCRPDDRAGRNVEQVTFRRSAPARFVVPHDFRGTSMAAPHVAAAAALVLASGRLGPRPTTKALQAALTSTARDLGAPGRDRYYGAGLVDAAAALGAPPAPPATSPGI